MSCIRIERINPQIIFVIITYLPSAPAAYFGTKPYGYPHNDRDSLDVGVLR